MKVGFAQLAPVLRDAPANLAILERLAPQWSAADLVVLPELCNSGYRFTSKADAWAHAEHIADSPYVGFLHDLCTRNRQHIVAGFNERDGDELFNTSLLIGPGGIVGKYRKIHLFCDEKDYFRPGNLGLPVFELPQCKIGMLICFDWLFPEAWRILALKGADIICHPSNLVLPGLCQRAVPIHAVINRVFVITANRIGTEQDLTFTGLSIIAGPHADVLAQAGPEEECVTLVEIDPVQARDKMLTARNHALDDRRPEEYQMLCEAGLAR
jgi:predicted amidohydrolase